MPKTTFNLTAKEKAFCKNYVEGMPIIQAYRQAGYSQKSSDNVASSSADQLLHKPKIAQEIQRLQKLKEDESIATAQEVMQYFTRVMRGEIKDQFGIEASLSERTKAGMELAKRTIDIDNRAKGVADNKIEISLDWKR